MKNKVILLLSFILMFAFQSCGYSTRSNLDTSLKTIYVEPFKNKIDFTSEGRRNLYLPLLEIKARNAVIDRYQFDGNLNVVKEDHADLILRGELINYQRGVLRYTDNNDVQEYRVQIFVSLELFDPQEQKILWREPNFVGEATYFTTGALAKSEDIAVQEAAIDLAKRVVERTIENW